MASSPQKSTYFSTITQKAQVPDETQKHQEHQRILEKFKSMVPPEELGPIKFIKMASSIAFGPQVHMKERLTFTDQTTIQLILGKKGKMMGKPVFREITLSRTESDLLSICQEKHNKSYAAPTEFIAETKDDYRQRSASLATKVEKKKTLPWEAKEIADCSYRILFKRDSAEGDKEPDTAFYFKFRDDFEKTKNYLKFIKLLEIDSASPEKPNVVLERLAMSFKEAITAKIRDFIQMRAQAINSELRREREKSVQISLTVNELDKRLVRGLVSSWSKYIIDSELYKQEQERLAAERKRGIESALKQASLLKTFDDDLVRHFAIDWKARLEARYATDRRDIKVFFNTLELVSDVIQPTIKLEIRFKKEYPEIPVVNGVQILNKFVEYNLSCQLKYSKSTKVSCWNIYPSAHKPADIRSPTQNLNKQASGPLNEPNIARDDQFFLQFSGFRSDYLDCVEVKVILYDETSTIIGYHYAGLKNMYTVVNRGHELWLCLKVSSEGRTKFPLIHLNINAQPMTNNATKEANIETSSQESEYIEDTFYNYRFKFPVITPKQLRLVELTPVTWDITDRKSRSPQKTKVALNPEQVKEIRSKLYSHYYQNTTRQIAHLTRSAYLWGELQDELMAIASQEKNPSKEPIYIDDQYLRRLVRSQLGLEESAGSEQSANLDNAVSFLFKKDQWESRSEWGNLHEKLKKICRKGIPSQYRINLWSELGKVVYFVELTETVLRQEGQSEGEGENFMEKSKRVYETLLRRSERENSQLYQALEDDIVFLAGSQGKEGLVHEKYLRKICRSFIMWTRIMSSDSVQNSKAKYNVAYSRDLLTLCYGLIICQTCRSIEERVVIEEDQVFWLLVSISSYILATYYETNEEAVGVDTLVSRQTDANAETKKKNSLGYSALRCNRIKGIKNDLLLLKVMLKESEKDIYYKFEELGLPLEYYFAEHMTTLFINLFNPGLMFRCWDIMFFEGSSTNGARCNKLIVCILYTVLKECKSQIMKAKKPEDLKFIIELFGRFHTKYGDLIKKAYTALATCLEVSLPANPSMIDRLAHLKHVIFTDIHKNINKDIKAIEKRLENHYNSIYQQNIAIYNLVNARYNYTPGQESEYLSYPILSRMIKDLKTALISDRNALHKRSVRNVHLRIHEIILSNDQIVDTVNISIIFGQEKMTRNYVNPNHCNIDLEFSIAHSDDLNNDMLIEVFNQNQVKVGSLNIHVKGFPSGVANKLNLKLENNDVKIVENVSVSQMNLSIVLKDMEFEEGVEGYQPLLLPELENPTYKALRKAKFGNTSEPADKSDSDATPENSPLSRKEGENVSINYQNPCTRWKERYVMTYEAFVGIIKTIAPAWIDAANLNAVYNVILQANMPRKFCITDFFVLLILFTKLTLNQRIGLLFDLYKGLSPVSADTGVTTNALKGLLTYLYEVFMVYIPQNEVENMVDLAIDNTTCYVRKVVLNGKQKLNVEYPRQMLNRIANYMHVYAGTREVYTYSQSMVKMLKEYYEKEMSVNFLDKSGPPQTRNELKISYVTNNMSHEIKLYVDENWRLIEDPEKEGIEDTRLYRSIGHNHNTLSLTNAPLTLSQDKFSAILQRVPLIDYLCSMENINSENVFTSVHDVKFTVTMGGETVYTAKPSFTTVTEDRNQVPPSSSRRILRTQIKKFPYYLENWEGTVRHAHNLIKRSVDMEDMRGGYRTLEGAVPLERLNIYMPYTQIARTIKKNLIKTVSDTLDKSRDHIRHLHSNLFDANLWNLDYDVSIKVNNSHIVTVTDNASTPFNTLMSSLDQKDVQSVEVIFALWDQVPAQDKKHRYNHSATYKYADGSLDWLPCEIQFVYQRGNVGGDKTIGELSNKEFEGYGVVFEKFPNEIMLKPKNEVALAYKVDLSKLELRRFEETTN